MVDNFSPPFLVLKDHRKLKLYPIYTSLAATIVEKLIFKDPSLIAMLPPSTHNMIYMMDKIYPPMMDSCS